MMESAQLREQVRKALPANALELMDDIEAFAQREILFSFNDRPPPAEYPGAAACCVFEDHARILLREAAPISPQDILHELLHIRRYWIERTPQLEPIAELDDPDHWDVTARIENLVEHLVIVPQEASYGFAPRAVWDKGALSEWSQYPWPNNQEPFARRLGWVLGWLNCELMTDPAIVALATECLTKEGVLGEAQRLQRDVKTRIRNKPRCLLAVIRAVRIRRQDVRLAYLDIKAKTKRFAKMPMV
jgi:hypothetical protein